MRKIIIATNCMNHIAAFDNSTKQRVDPVLTAGIASVQLPERPKPARGSTTIYPFDALEVGQSFGISNKSAKKISSIVSNQNRKNRAPVLDKAGKPVFETKTLTDAAGVKTEVPDTSKPKIEQTKHFETRDVTPEIAKLIAKTPLEGATVLVTRVK